MVVNKLEELVKDFTIAQLRYIAIRPFVRFDRDAAKAIGVAPETVCRWEEKADVDKAVRMMALDGVTVASKIFERYLPQAAHEMVTELEHKRTEIRHRAAKEILDRGGLVIKRRLEHSGPGGGPIETRKQVVDLSDLNDDELNDLSRLLARIENRNE